MSDEDWVALGNIADDNDYYDAFADRFGSDQRRQVFGPLPLRTVGQIALQDCVVFLVRIGTALAAHCSNASACGQAAQCPLPPRA